MPSRKNKRVLMVILIAILLPVVSGFAQVTDQVAASLKRGDARQLSGYFNANVELVVLDKDNVYSKAQAQQIVSNFFAEHVPEDFNVIHQGGKEAKYVIGTLKTNNGNFRISFLLKQNNGKDYIHQLRIEKQ